MSDQYFQLILVYQCLLTIIVMWAIRTNGIETRRKFSEKLQEQSNNFKDLSAQINSLKQSQSSQTEDISKAIIAEISARSTFPYWKLDELAEEMRRVISLFK